MERLKKRKERWEIETNELNLKLKREKMEENESGRESGRESRRAIERNFLIYFFLLV